MLIDLNDRESFEHSEYQDGCCSCQASGFPPCAWCTHPGNDHGEHWALADSVSLCTDMQTWGWASVPSIQYRRLVMAGKYVASGLVPSRVSHPGSPKGSVQGVALLQLDPQREEWVLSYGELGRQLSGAEGRSVPGATMSEKRLREVAFEMAQTRSSYDRIGAYQDPRTACAEAKLCGPTLIEGIAAMHAKVWDGQWDDLQFDGSKLV